VPDFPELYDVPIAPGLSVPGLYPEIQVFTSFASRAYPTVNKGLFYPFWLEKPMLAQQMAYCAGNTIAGNVDVGIFDIKGNLLVSSGGTAMAGGAGSFQIINITDTLLAQGYYMKGIACDSITATMIASNVGPQVGASFGFCEQLTAYPFSTGANPATFVRLATSYVVALSVNFKSVM